MAVNEYLQVELVEKDIVRIDFTEKEIVNVEFKSVDVLDYYAKTTLATNYVVETPTKLTVKRFQTSDIWVAGTLIVFFNGLKEKNITEVTTTTFDLPIDTIVADTIEVQYMKVAS